MLRLFAASNDAAPIALPTERRLRVWPTSVSEVARWCRAQKTEPLPQDEVPGANVFERRQLAALGGIAAALTTRSSEPVRTSAFPIVVRRWLVDAPQPPQELIDALCSDLKGGIDPLALVYERIVSGPRRRLLGTFFTPGPVLEYMRHVVRRLPPPTVVADPGAGVGAFTVAALQWWPEAEVHAVDVNLVTLGLLAARPDLTRRKASDSRPRLRIRHEDFLEWLTNSWPDLRGSRLLMGNPPYTRHQQMTSTEKVAARAAVGSLAPGLRAGLSTYFLAASLAALKPSDALCLLLPANWLEADYARSVRQKLWSVVKRPTELHLFPNVLYLGPERSRRQRLRVVRVSGELNSGFHASAVSEIERVGHTPQSFSPRKLLASPPRARMGKTEDAPLGVLATVRRGVATGANAFFLRTKSEADELPVGACVPAISRLRELAGDDLDDVEHAQLSSQGVRCWLLHLKPDSARDPRVREIIDEGEALSIHERYLCMVRDPWYVLETIPPPDILVGPMGKEQFRIVVNTVEAIPTNTLYGLRINRRSASSLAGAVESLADWLRGEHGQQAMLSAARNHHGDGLVKLEPGALKQIRIPEHVLAMPADLP